MCKYEVGRNLVATMGIGVVGILMGLALFLGYNGVLLTSVTGTILALVGVVFGVHLHKLQLHGRDLSWVTKCIQQMEEQKKGRK